MNTFNLIDDPFIPTEIGLVSLSYILAHAHEIRYIQCENPLQTAALYRFLLPFVYRSHGVNTDAEWIELWRKGEFNTTGYLAKWHDAFYLFGDHPFYQDSTLNGEKCESINKLYHWTNNDASLFCKMFGGMELSPCQVAVALICYQTMSVNAGRGLTLPRSNFLANAGRSTMIVMRGSTLFETIMLNCRPLAGLRIEQASKDSPWWERPNYEKTAYIGYLDYLTSPARRVRLVVNKNGTISQFHDARGCEAVDNIIDPFAMYKFDEKDKRLKPIPYYHTRNLWRQFQALKTSLDSNNNSVTYDNNRNIDLLDSIPGHQDYQFGYTCFGMMMDGKLTKYRDVTQTELVLRISDIKNEGLYNQIRNAVEESERVGKILNDKLYFFFKEFGGNNTTKDSYVEFFWGEVDSMFTNFLANFHINPVGKADVFCDMVRRLARNVYEKATRGQQVGNIQKYLDVLYEKGHLRTFLHAIYNMKGTRQT